MAVMMRGIILMVVSIMLMGGGAALSLNKISSSSDAGAAPQASALFVFGDSLVDNGNNNFLSSMAKSNYYPYGIDSNRGATGRFSNGDTFVDYLGTYIYLPSTY